MISCLNTFAQKSLKEYQFDTLVVANKVTKATIYSSTTRQDKHDKVAESDYKIYSTAEFDSKGRLINRVRYEGDSPWNKLQNEFDTKNNLSKVIFTDYKEESISTTKNVFDENNSKVNVSLELIDNGSTTIHEWEYNLYGFLTLETMSFDNKVTYTIINKYKDDSLIMESTKTYYMKDTDRYIIKTVFEYDTNMKLQSIIEYDKDGEIIGNRTPTIDSDKNRKVKEDAHDKSGHLIKECTKVDGGTICHKYKYNEKGWVGSESISILKSKDFNKDITLLQSKSADRVDPLTFFLAGSNIPLLIPGDNNIYYEYNKEGLVTMAVSENIKKKQCHDCSAIVNIFHYKVIYEY